MKKYNLIIYSILISFIIISLSIFFISYNSKDNRSLRELKQISSNLNKINYNLSSLVKDYTIDTNKTKDYLNQNIENIKVLSNTLSNLDISNKNSSIKTKLNLSINSTLNLYNECISILNNPENISDNSIISSITDLKNECDNSYVSLKEDNINIEFSSDSNLFFENFIYYINTILKLNRDTNFKNTQNREFIYKLESFCKTFDVLNEDLFIAIDKIREDNRDLNIIIDDIYSKEKTYDDIQISLASLSIPEDKSDIYNALVEYINSYKPYLNSIKTAVISEKSLKGNNLSSSDILKIYKDSKDKREYSLNCYNTFKNKLKN